MDQAVAGAGVNQAPCRPAASQSLFARWLKSGSLAVALLAVIGQSLLAIFPLRGLVPLGTHDGISHLFRAVQLESCLLEGNLYPRWAPDFAQGFGYPVFNFHAPLSNYLQVFLHWSGLSSTDAFRAGLALGLLLSGIGMYLLTADLLGRCAGLLAALAYVYAPYIHRNAYVRGNLPELLALAIVPFVLLAVRRVICRPDVPRLLAAVLAYSLLIITHNLTAFLASPFILGYGAILLVWRRSWRALLLFVAAVLLGLGLSAFYWLPALGEQEWVQVGRMAGATGLDPIQFQSIARLLGIQTPADVREVRAEPDYVVGMGQVGLAGLGLLALGLRRTRREAALLLIPCALVAPVMIFMVGPDSQPVWRMVPWLNVIQFPWRLLGFASIALAPLAGASSLLLPASVDPRRGAVALARPLGLLALAAAVVLPFMVYPYYMRGQELDTVSDNPTVADALGYEGWAKVIGMTAFNEFLPKWVKYLPMKAVETLGPCNDCLQSERLDRGALPKGILAERVAQRSNYIAYRFANEQEVAVLYRIIYYPAWHAYVDGKPVETGPYPGQGLGWVTFKVPAGGGLVELRFDDTPLASLGNRLSLVAGGAILLLAAVALARRRRDVPSARAIAQGASWDGGWILVVGVGLLLVAKMAYIDGSTTWFRIASAPGSVPKAQTQMAASFGDEILMSGFSLSSQQAMAGQPVEVKVFWEPMVKPHADYVAYVQVLPEGATTPVAMDEGANPRGVFSSRWELGKYYPSEHRINLPADLKPGKYTVVAGLQLFKDWAQKVPLSGTQPPRYTVTLGDLTVTP